MIRSARRVLTSAVAIGAIALLAMTPTSRADQISTDTEFGIVEGGDAALCDGTRAVGAVIGKSARSAPAEWEVATSLTNPIDSLVSAWRTGCTWARPSGVILAVHIEAYRKNQAYNGKGEAWTPLKLVNTIISIADGAAAGGYVSFDPKTLAKTFKSKPATSNVYVIGDKATKGKRQAQLVVWGNTEAYVFAVISNSTVNATQVAWKSGANLNLP